MRRSDGRLITIQQRTLLNKHKTAFIIVIFVPDFRIIATLEKLKQEAAEITRKVEETDVVMAEVEAVSDQYSALSHYCSSIYFTMEGLNLVSQAPNSI